jgi:hypothetical protein
MEVRLMTARYLLDPNAARELVAPGCEAHERLLPGDTALRAFCLAELAHHEGEAGLAEASATHWQQASALLAGEPAVLPVGQAAIIEGHAARRGDPGAATPQLRAAIAELDGRTWWSCRDRAELELVLGENLGSTAEAVATLRAAVADFEASRAQARDVYGQQLLARAHLGLARLLTNSGGSIEEISLHLDEAERWFRAHGAAYSWRAPSLREVREALPATTDSPPSPRQ